MRSPSVPTILTGFSYSATAYMANGNPVCMFAVRMTFLYQFETQLLDKAVECRIVLPDFFESLGRREYRLYLFLSCHADGELYVTVV